MDGNLVKKNYIWLNLSRHLCLSFYPKRVKWSSGFNIQEYDRVIQYVSILALSCGSFSAKFAKDDISNLTYDSD